MSLPLFLFMLLILTTTPQDLHSQKCQQFIKKFQKQIQNPFNISDPRSLPLTTIMFSGFTTNNPGQYLQCVDQSYSYFMLHNDSILENSYTALCVPQYCTQQEIYEYFSPTMKSTVYSYPKSRTPNGLSIAGLVILSIWLAALVICSILASYNSQQQKQIPEKPQKQRTSINSQQNQRSSEKSEQGRSQFHLFNFYKGYQQLFIQSPKKSIFSPIIFISTFGYLIAIQFSYRQTIAQNQTTTALSILNSFGGILVCNTQIVLHTIMFILGLRLAYCTYKITTIKKMLRFAFDQIIKKWLVLFFITFVIYTSIQVFVNQPLSKLWDINNAKNCSSTLWEIWFLFKYMQTNCQICLPWLSIFTSEIFFILLSMPLLLTFKAHKKIGYSLFGLLIIVSMLVSSAILVSKNVIYQPTKLMNGQKQYVIDYQSNTFVRMGAFYFGLIFGLFLIQGLQKTQNVRPYQSQIAKKIRKNAILQLILQVFGTALMLLNFLLIIPYLDINNPNKQPYSYLILSPFFFIVGLAFFIVSSFWEGQSISTSLVNKLLCWNKWVHLDRLCFTMLMVGPMVIGVTNYGMQSMIFYDWTYLTIYTIGDLVLVYIFSLIIASTFQCQLNTIFLWLQHKIYAQESKYSVLIIEEQ